MGVFCGSLQWEIVVWLRFTSVFSKEYTQESLLTFCTNNLTVIILFNRLSIQAGKKGCMIFGLVNKIEEFSSFNQLFSVYRL